MKKIYCVLVFFGAISISFSQDLINSKTKFSDFAKEPKTIPKYKILELRYIVIDTYEKIDSLTIENKQYKCFQNRNQAIEYYYAIRHVAQKKEVYYIKVLEEKQTEYFPFRE